MADGSRLRHFREIPLERLEVEFQDGLAGGAEHDSFLDGEKVGDPGFLQAAGIELISEIVPLGDLRPHGKAEIAPVDYRLLAFFQNSGERRILQFFT